MNKKSNHMLSILGTAKVTSFSVVFVLCFSIQLAERMAQVFESNRIAKESKTKVISESNYKVDQLT